MRDLSFREFVAVVLMGLFAYVLVKNPTDATIIGALLTGFAGAWGYYLGGSKVGADTAAKNADTVAETARATTSDPQPVTVTNDPTNPVPVKEPEA